MGRDEEKKKTKTIVYSHRMLRSRFWSSILFRRCVQSCPIRNGQDLLNLSDGTESRFTLTVRHTDSVAINTKPKKNL